MNNRRVLARPAIVNFMKYRNHRKEPYFTFVKNGQKTIEGRLRKGKYAKIQSGDIIEVNNEDETEKIDVLVKRVAYYRSIKEMLTSEPLKRILPNVNTIDQGINAYREFYSPEQEKEFGMVAIEVEKTVG